jgi:hypothetical protein
VRYCAAGIFKPYVPKYSQQKSIKKECRMRVISVLGATSILVSGASASAADSRQCGLVFTPTTKFSAETIFQLNNPAADYFIFDSDNKKATDLLRSTLSESEQKRIVHASQIGKFYTNSAALDDSTAKISTERSLNCNFSLSVDNISYSNQVGARNLRVVYRIKNAANERKPKKVTVYSKIDEYSNDTDVTVSVTTQDLVKSFQTNVNKLYERALR